ncbi:MAG: carboxypeptidase regulatory-like domain-containing protein [Oceanospirillaceae bacterium]|nr:carboxypeptidase regulatory-like domain-containing protein [Oceanospirillaceae bacterium]
MIAGQFKSEFYTELDDLMQFDDVTISNAKIKVVGDAGQSKQWKVSQSEILMEGDFTINNTLLKPQGSQIYFKSQLISNNGSLELVESQVEVPVSTQQSPTVWNDIKLTQNSTLTHAVPSNQFAGINWISKNLLIDSTSKIDLTAKGLLSISKDQYRWGGSYGGKGGYSEVDAFGNAQTPYSLGVGGGSNNYQSLGGGLIKVNAVNAVIDGLINVNGQNAKSSSYGAASGGSVWLTAGSLSGDGSITSNGGISSGAGGGSGGRVAVYYSSAEGNLINNLTATGGSNLGEDGSIYTEQRELSVYIKNSTPTNGDLVLTAIDYFDIEFISDIDVATFTVADIQVTGPSPVVISEIEKLTDSTFRLKLSEPLSVQGDYSVSIGPDVRNSSGVPMDQNLNGIGGEASDVYQIDFEFKLPSEVISDDSEISGDSNPFEGMDVVLKGATLIASGEINLASLELTGVANLTVPDPVGNEASTLILNVGELIIGDAAKIDVSAKGLLSGIGLAGAGGSHAGFGGRLWEIEEDAQSAQPYGNYEEPNQPGLGGTDFYGQPTSLSRGGAAIQINAQTIIVNGAIQSNGSNIIGQKTGAGAGGSILIRTNELSGTGQITAQGGHSQIAGNGSGGRVAIHYSLLNNFDKDTQINVSGGGVELLPITNEYGQLGSAGTMYLFNNNSEASELKIKNDYFHETMAKTPLLSSNREAFIENSNVTFENINIRNLYTKSSILNSSSNANVNLNQLIAENTEINTGIAWNMNDGVFDLTAGNKLNLQASTDWNSIIVRDGATISTVDYKPEGEQVSLKARYLEIEEGGGINVDGKGRQTEFDNTFVGGSHGGLGGYSRELGSKPLPIIGSKYAPTEYGVGGIGKTQDHKTKGGGSLYIEADDAVINGIITANGEYGHSSWYSGGSGGSIWLNLGNLSGAGSIVANGGVGSNASSGSGGRIALYYNVNDEFDFSKLEVKGGINSSAGWTGEDGTVYVSNKTSAIKIVEPSQQYIQSTNRIRVVFSSYIQPSSFTLSDIQLEKEGSFFTVENIEKVSPLEFDIFFAEVLTEGEYLLSIQPNALNLNGLGVDQNEDGQIAQLDDMYYLNLTIDSSTPGLLMINSHDTSVVPNYSKNKVFTIEGENEADSLVYVNGQIATAITSTSWAISMNEPDGEHEYEIYQEDQAGNLSENIYLTVLVDSRAPSLYNPWPNNYQKAVDSIRIYYNENSLSGLDPAKINISLNGGELPSGTLSHTPPSTVLYAFNEPLAEGSYNVAYSFTDKAGNTGTYNDHQVIVDATNPIAPQLNQTEFTTNDEYILLSGISEIGTRIRVHDHQKNTIKYVTNYLTTNEWSYSQQLSEGDNTFTILAEDKAGNQSPEVIVTASYDNTAPDVVAIKIYPEGDGKSVLLNWQSYDEQANGGDVVEYRVYQSTNAFASITESSVTLVASQRQKEIEISNLTRNQPHYFAVVAVDRHGLFKEEVNAQAVIPIDIQGPGQANVVNISVTNNTALIKLKKPADEDLAKLVATLNGQSQNVSEFDASGLANVTFTNLTNNTKYDLTVIAYDQTGIASTPFISDIYAQLDNPQITDTASHSGRISMNWAINVPSTYVQSYLLYASAAPFSRVEGMSPKVTLSGAITSGGIAGLNNNETYYIAVAAKNPHGAINPAVNAVEVTPEADTQGPIITPLKFAGATLDSNLTVSEMGEITANVSDKSGLGNVSLYIDDEIVDSQYGLKDTYRHQFDPKQYTDGVHNIRLVANDTFSNESSLEALLNVELSAPQAPVLNGESQITGQATYQINGYSVEGTQVTLYQNGDLLADAIPLNSNAFSYVATLKDGDNIFTAKANFIDRSKFSPLSNQLNIEYDGTIPKSPSELSILEKSAGRIVLNWSNVSDESVVGYSLYRAEAAFTVTTQAEKLNTTLLKTNSYEDLPLSDGEYFYAVVAVNELGTESTITTVVSATSDREGPIVDVVYQTDGVLNNDSSIYGKGNLDVTVSFSEPLRNAPYFALTPEGGVPKVLSLKESFGEENTYQAQLNLNSTLIAGKYFAVVGAYDELGNRTGTVNTGQFIKIDTQGPKVQSLTTSPVSPIKNTQDGQSVTVEFSLDESVADTNAVKIIPGTRDTQFNFTAFPEFEAGIDVTQVDANKWQATFLLPGDLGVSDAGEEITESLLFKVIASDSLSNVQEQLLEQYRVDVYQGDLPALSAPFGFSAQALPNGKVKLAWQKIDNANNYNIYRKLTGEPDFELITTQAEDSIEFIDGESNQLQNNRYSYYITSVRNHNEQIAESTASNVVEVTVDGQAPTRPTNLRLALAANGVLAEWDVPSGENPSDLYYSLYRLSNDWDDASSDLTGIEPALSPIRGAAILDSKPSAQFAKYAVTATDETGNESLPSETVYLNVALLPVTEMKVTEADNGTVSISWKGITGTPVTYGVIQKIADQETLIAQDLGQTNITDTAITLERTRDVTYGVIAKDESDAESLNHEITLPSISIQKVDGATQINRGVMNKIQLRVDNQGETDIRGAKLKLNIDVNGEQKNHTSESFNVSAGSFTTVSLVVGGYQKLEDFEQANVSFMWTPAQGDFVEINRALDFEIGDDTILIKLLADNIIAGSDASIKLKANNHTDIALDFVVAQNKGKSPSTEARVKILNANGDLVSIAPIKLTLGSIVNLSSGHSVIRIPSNSEFISPEITIPVPSDAPDDIRLELEVDKFHYQLGLPSHVEMKGLTVGVDVETNKTEYRVDLEPTVESIIAGEKFTIKGRTVDRANNESTGNKNVKLVFSINGFEQIRNTVTDAEGKFEYELESTKDVGGIYYISALHPQITERPIMAQVSVQVLDVYPTKGEIRVPYNYETNMPLTLTASKQWTEKELSIQVSSETPLPSGINMQLPANVILDQGKVFSTLVKISATKEAPESGSILLEVRDVAADKLLSYIRLNYEFSEAQGRLAVDRSFVQTGVAQSDSTTEKIMVKNTGFSDIQYITSYINNKDGSSAPNWVSIVSGQEINGLSIGESQEIELMFNPADSIVEGQYQFDVLIKSAEDNLQKTIPIIVSVSQSGIGDVYFHVSDIYTATLDNSGNAIPGLKGAKLKLQNELVYSQVYEATSNEFGDVTIEGIPAGRYTYRVSAFDHETITGRLWVKPDTVTSETAFLMNKLISVEFEVKEITIEDRYEIVLSATYETNVPAPVVTIEPMMINLPMMDRGQVYQGELVITNHGLINANSIQDRLPRGDSYARFEYQRALPETLEAGQVFVLPYRIVALKNFADDGTQLISAGCNNHDYNGGVGYEFECANGTEGSGQANISANANDGGSGCGGPGDKDWSPSGPGGNERGGGGLLPSSPTRGDEGADGAWMCMDVNDDDGDEDTDC